MSDRLLARRPLLAGFAVAATLPLAGGARATVPVDPAKRNLRAVQRFHLGDLRVTMFDDARFTFPAAAFATNRPKEAIAAFLSGFGLPTETVSLHMQIALIESGPHRLLLDTGMGDVTFPGNEPDNGRLLASLSAVGLTPEQITSVVISHGHPDHVGGASIGGEPVFRNARYHIPARELEFWTQKPGREENFANFMLAVGNDKLEPLRRNIHFYSHDDELIPGVRAISAPGHTLAHHAFLLGSGDNRLLHLVDAAVHYLVGTEHVDWSLAVEMDPDRAVDTRRRLFRKAAESRMLVAGYHFPFPGVGRIVGEGSDWRFVPMQLV